MNEIKHFVYIVHAVMIFIISLIKGQAYIYKMLSSHNLEIPGSYLVTHIKVLNH